MDSTLSSFIDLGILVILVLIIFFGSRWFKGKGTFESTSDGSDSDSGSGEPGHSHHSGHHGGDSGGHHGGDFGGHSGGDFGGGGHH